MTINFKKENFYSSKTTLDKFYTVHVIWSNDLTMTGVRRFKKDPAVLFQKKDENISSGTTIYLVPRT